MTCSSNYELFTACFDTFEDNKTTETTEICFRNGLLKTPLINLGIWVGG